ncbi:hypothetical protein J6590_005331 [Homalodisca vitripennis]|nr:hypothetical protein J6590_005331 [Homalodisca vitripennis]
MERTGNPIGQVISNTPGGRTNVIIVPTQPLSVITQVDRGNIITIPRFRSSCISQILKYDRVPEEATSRTYEYTSASNKTRTKAPAFIGNPIPLGHDAGRGLNNCTLSKGHGRGRSHQRNDAFLLFICVSII